MLKNKNIWVLIIILIFLTSILLGCQELFQVKRIEQDPSIAKGAEEIETDSKKNGEQYIDEKDLSKEGLNKEKRELEEAVEETNKASNEITNEKLDEEIDEEQENAEVAGSQQQKTIKPVILDYLFLTGYKEEGLGEPKFRYIVGQDHFVQLEAGLNIINDNPIVITIKWANYPGDKVYKLETITLNPQDNQTITSLLGLTKKVADQNLLPDALGDYAVYIEINEEIISKSRYAITIN